MFRIHTDHNHKIEQKSKAFRFVQVKKFIEMMPVSVDKESLRSVVSSRFGISKSTFYSYLRKIEELNRSESFEQMAERLSRDGNKIGWDPNPL